VVNSVFPCEYRKQLKMHPKSLLLVVDAPRYPTVVERLLFGIVCTGFCATNSPEGIESCHKACILPCRALRSRKYEQRLEASNGQVADR